MKKYIGVKIIDAKPMSEHGFLNKVKNQDIPTNQENREGYFVVYPDGYESWSPKDVFEEAYHETGGMPFGLAVEAMKKGLKVARKGWNGKDMFIYLQESSNLEPDEIRHPIVKEHANQFNGSPIYICGHIDMKNAQGNIMIGWLASQTDMLSDDWVIVE